MRRYLAAAAVATVIAGGAVAVPAVSGAATTRQVGQLTTWYKLPARTVHGFASTPGAAYVNTKQSYDWAFLAAGAYDAWRHHRSPSRAYGADGPNAGSKRYTFNCVVKGNIVTCRNAFRAAMRYLPKGR